MDEQGTIHAGQKKTHTAVADHWRVKMSPLKPKVEWLEGFSPRRKEDFAAYSQGYPYHTEQFEQPGEEEVLWKVTS